MANTRLNYVDASALVKLWLEEAMSQDVRTYFNGQSVILSTSICFLEALQVIGGKFKNDKFEQEKYLAACEELFSLRRDYGIEIHDVDILKRETFDEVEKLIKQYDKGKKKRLDVSDAFQLLTVKNILPCVPIASKLLVTADSYLATVARQERVPVWHVDDPPPNPKRLTL